MNEEEKLEMIDYKLDMTEDDEIVISLLYQKIDILEGLIAKQQAEIEDCKKCVIRDDIHNYIEELEKKDKIIDLMAEKINEAYFEEYDFDEWFEEKICPVQQKIDYGYVVDLIKQYFERKVKNGI